MSRPSAPITFQAPKHLSVSSIQSYERCPYQWKQKYVNHRRIDMPAPVVFGGIFARTMEALHLGRDAEVYLVKAFAEESERFRNKGLTLAPDVEYAMQLLHIYQKLPPYQGKPEQSFTLRLPPEFRVPVPLVGYLDLMTAGGVIEMKTSRARWTQQRADTEYQAALYAHAFRMMHDREPSEVRYLVFNTNWPDLLELVTHPGRAELERFGKAAGEMWKHVMAQDFERRCGDCEFCLMDFPREVAA